MRKLADLVIGKFGVVEIILKINFCVHVIHYPVYVAEEGHCGHGRDGGENLHDGEDRPHLEGTHALGHAALHEGAHWHCLYKYRVKRVVTSHRDWLKSMLQVL